MPRYLKQEGGAVPLVILLVAVGLIAFLTISNTFNFKDSIFNNLFPKPPSSAKEQTKKLDSVPDEILVKFKGGVDEKTKQNVHKLYGLTKKSSIDKLSVDILKVNEKSKDRVIDALKKNDLVEYAEPNYLLHPDLIPNDPAWTNAEWNLQKINAPTAWDITTGSTSVVVADVTGGVKADHEDLIGKILPGWNFVDNNTDTSDTNNGYSSGHGTIVAGIIGASTNNGKGVASLGWNIPILPLKATDSSGNINIANAANAIIYAADHGAKAINISYSGGAPTSIMLDAENYAWNKGAIISASGGNSVGAPIEYPAADPLVIGVEGINVDDHYLWNIGTGLDVVAPGQGVYSTDILSSLYDPFSGSSFAAPHVAALAGLIYSVNPNFTPQQVTDIITSTSVDLGTPGWDQYYGYGRIDAGAAVQKATTITPLPPDTTIPTVSIILPTSGSTLSSGQNINVTASDDRAVLKVEVYLDNNLFCSDISSPYLCYWDTRNSSNGSHTLVVKAYDGTGNIGVSSPVSVTISNTNVTPTPSPSSGIQGGPTPTPNVDKTPPAVSITSPFNGAAVARNTFVIVSANATDNIAVSKVEFYVNNSLTCTDTALAYTCSWKVPSAKGKSYTIQARATDASNNSSTSTINVTSK